MSTQDDKPTQEEKLSTYSAFAASDAEAQKRSGLPPIVTALPRQPANSPWSADPVPPEPPLGVDISAVPDMKVVQR